MILEARTICFHYAHGENGHPGEEANNLVCCWISRALMVKNSVLIEPAIGKEDLSSNLTLLGLNFCSDEKKIFLY